MARQPQAVAARPVHWGCAARVGLCVSSDGYASDARVSSVATSHEMTQADATAYTADTASRMSLKLLLYWSHWACYLLSRNTVSRYEYGIR